MCVCNKKRDYDRDCPKYVNFYFLIFELLSLFGMGIIGIIVYHKTKNFENNISLILE